MRPPGPSAPIAARLPELGLDALGALVSEHGPALRVDQAGHDAPAFLFGRPEHVQHVFATRRANYGKGWGMERVRILMGKGLIVSDGDLWKAQRRRISPAFHRRALGGLDAVIARHNDALVARWAAAADRAETVDVGEDVSDLTLAILLEALFSEDLPALTGGAGAGPFAMVKEEARDLSFAQRFRALGAPIRALIERRRRDGLERADLLGLMMASRDEAGAAMTDRLLVDEVFTLLIAGHETTAEMLAWSWYLLGRHPERQASLLEPGFAGCVAQEALRLYPPVWIIPRRALAADEIAGFDVPAGADVFVSPYFVHRDPALWPEPEAFRPERFLDAAPARYTYLAFGAGPRLCVGDQLALAEARAHLSRVAAALALEPVDDAPPVLEPRINLRRQGPLVMRPVRRA